jgi:hypothetical protein
MTLIILLLLTTVYLILMVPVMAKITVITMSSMPIPEAQLNRALDIVHKLRYLQVFSGVFSITITLFLYALILYIITLVAKPAITYTKSFILIVYSYFAVTLGALINTGLLFMRGIEKITNPFEVALTGLNLLTTLEKVGATCYTFLGLINPFQLWFVILLSVGIKIFAGIKYPKALVICVIFWLLTVLYPVVMVMFTEITLKKAGIM